MTDSLPNYGFIVFVLTERLLEGIQKGRLTKPWASCLYFDSQVEKHNSERMLDLPTNHGFLVFVLTVRLRKYSSNPMTG